MKCYLFTNSSQITAFVCLFLFAAISTYSAEPDTVKVASKGENNRVIVNSQQSDALFLDSVDASVRGEIIQTGENNHVEINTGGKAANSKHQIPNSKQQITKSKNKVTETKTDLGGRHSGKEKQAPKGRNQITVKQTGKNNSAKISTP